MQLHVLHVNKQGACLYFINIWHLLHIIIKTRSARFYKEKSTPLRVVDFSKGHAASVPFWDVGTRVACLYSIYWPDWDKCHCVETIQFHWET